jgi:hypothetical protein
MVRSMAVAISMALLITMLPGAAAAGGGKPVVVGTYDVNDIQGYKIRAYVDKDGVEGGYFDEPDASSGSLVVARRQLADVCVDGDLALLVSAPYEIGGSSYFDFLVVLDDGGKDLMQSGGGVYPQVFVCEDELAGVQIGALYPIEKGGVIVH